jgi:DNA-binding LytR/AlgR family response regulator
MNGFYEKMKLKSKNIFHVFCFQSLLRRLQNLRIELLEKMLKDNEARRYDTSIERINRQCTKRQVEREDFVKTNRLHYLRGKIDFLIKINSIIFFILSDSSFTSKTITNRNKIC